MLIDVFFFLIIFSITFETIIFPFKKYQTNSRFVPSYKAQNNIFIDLLKVLRPSFLYVLNLEYSSYQYKKWLAKYTAFSFGQKFTIHLKIVLLSLLLGAISSYFENTFVVSYLLYYVIFFDFNVNNINNFVNTFATL